MSVGKVGTTRPQRVVPGFSTRPLAACTRYPHGVRPHTLPAAIRTVRRERALPGVSDRVRRQRVAAASRRRRGRRETGVALAQGLPFEGEVIGVMHQAVEDGIGQGGIADELMPMQNS